MPDSSNLRQYGLHRFLLPLLRYQLSDIGLILKAPIKAEETLFPLPGDIKMDYNGPMVGAFKPKVLTPSCWESLEP